MTIRIKPLPATLIIPEPAQQAVGSSAPASQATTPSVAPALVLTVDKQPVPAIQFSSSLLEETSLSSRPSMVPEPVDNADVGSKEVTFSDDTLDELQRKGTRKMVSRIGNIKSKVGRLCVFSHE